MSDNATADPGKNWRAEVYRYEMDPFAKEFLAGLADSATLGVRTVGHVVVSGALLSIHGTTAVVKGCVDTTHQDTLDANGHSVRAADGPNANWRYVELATLSKTPDGWRVTSVDSQLDNGC